MFECVCVCTSTYVEHRCFFFQARIPLFSSLMHFVHTLIYCEQKSRQRKNKNIFWVLMWLHERKHKKMELHKHARALTNSAISFRSFSMLQITTSLWKFTWKWNTHSLCLSRPVHRRSSHPLFIVQIQMLFFHPQKSFVHGFDWNYTCHTYSNEKKTYKQTIIATTPAPAPASPLHHVLTVSMKRITLFCRAPEHIHTAKRHIEGEKSWNEK